VRRLILIATAFCALAAPAQAAAPSRLLVEATEFRFTLSRTTVKAGPAIVQLAIRGEDPHDLRLVPARGRGRASGKPAVVAETLPGAVAEWRGKLSRGRWTLYCSLPGHKKAGMRATLTVR
jgi:plastocyanin